MFKIFVIEDNIDLTVPEYVGDRKAVLFKKFSNKYVNKVVKGVGLAIALEGTFFECESRIIPNDGSAHFKIQFKLLLFAPVVNEVFTATVFFHNKKFIRFSVGFFSDLHVFPRLFPDVYKYDEDNGYWLKVNGDEHIPIKTGDVCNFKILEIRFNPEIDADCFNNGLEPLPVFIALGTIV